MRIILSSIILLFSVHLFAMSLPAKPKAPVIPKLNSQVVLIKKPTNLMKINSLPAKLSKAMQYSQAWVISYSKALPKSEIRRRVEVLQKHGLNAFSVPISATDAVLQIGPSVFKQKLKQQQKQALSFAAGSSKIVTWNIRRNK